MYEVSFYILYCTIRKIENVPAYICRSLSQNDFTGQFGTEMDIFLSKLSFVLEFK